MSSPTTDLLVFGAVLTARLLVPLAIPRFPLPAVLTALILDGVDQTIFQTYTTLSLDHYQGYDKALDIYYLSIAYIATMRNWTNLEAFTVSRFLYFYRLVGVALFAMVDARALLLVFPNTFEYFFIAYEAVGLRWDPQRMGKRLVLGVAAFLWVVVKLPQEYWIHVAQIDTTDLIKEAVFGVPVETGWGEIAAGHPGVVVGLGVALVLLVAAVRWFVTQRLPAADWTMTFDADAHARDVSAARERDASRMLAGRLLDRELGEKIAMVTLVNVIFAHVVPNVDATGPQLALGTALVITINAALSEWLVRRRVAWRSILTEFLAMAVVNAAVVLAFRLLLPVGDGSIHLGTALFFVLLVTLLVTLYDRDRPVHEARVLARAQPAMVPS